MSKRSRWTSVEIRSDLLRRGLELGERMRKARVDRSRRPNLKARARLRELWGS